MSTRSENFLQLAEWIARLPIGQHFDTSPSGDLEMQAGTQDEVAILRSCFPGVIWQKQYEESLAWWTYQGEPVPRFRRSGW